jgi:hypothetical protein
VKLALTASRAAENGIRERGRDTHALCPSRGPTVGLLLKSFGGQCTGVLVWYVHITSREDGRASGESEDYMQKGLHVPTKGLVGLALTFHSVRNRPQQTLGLAD